MIRLSRILLIGFVALPTLVWVQTSAAALEADQIIAYFGKEPVYTEELTFHIRDHIASTAIYFKTQHQMDLTPANWFQSHRGEVPAERLKDAALEACRRSKAVQILAVQDGGFDPLPFPGFSEACDQINQARQTAKSEGRIIYGPASFSPKQLYTYQLTNMRIQLRDDLPGETFSAREQALEKLIHQVAASMPIKLQTTDWHALVSEILTGTRD